MDMIRGMGKGTRAMDMDTIRGTAIKEGLALRETGSKIRMGRHRNTAATRRLAVMVRRSTPGIRG